jgi:hypothetical protein
MNNSSSNGPKLPQELLTTLQKTLAETFTMSKILKEISTLFLECNPTKTHTSKNVEMGPFLASLAENYSSQLEKFNRDFLAVSFTSELENEVENYDEFKICAGRVTDRIQTEQNGKIRNWGLNPDSDQLN